MSAQSININFPSNEWQHNKAKRFQVLFGFTNQEAPDLMLGILQHIAVIRQTAETSKTSALCAFDLPTTRIANDLHVTDYILNTHQQDLQQIQQATSVLLNLCQHLVAYQNEIVSAIPHIQDYNTSLQAVKTE